MRSIPPMVRALVIFAVAVLISRLIAAMLLMMLRADRTSALAGAMILIAVVMRIGGPIIGLFLAISDYRRMTRDPTKPSIIRVALSGDDRAKKTLSAMLFAFGLPAGLALMVFGLSMVIPAAWGAGGGDMPPGHGDPATMQVGWVLLYLSIGMAVVGLGLVAASLFAGIILLWNRGRSRGL